MEVVFKNTIAGLVELLPPGVRTPELEKQLTALGLPLNAPPSQMERSRWNQALRLCAVVVNPGDDESTAHFKLGYAVANRMRHSLSGKAQVAMAQLMGPRRTLELFRSTISSGSNYNQTRVVKGDDKSVEFWINETGEQHPSFFAGLLAACIEIAGGKDVRVSLRNVSAADGATYDVSWA